MKRLKLIILSTAIAIVCSSCAVEVRPGGYSYGYYDSFEIPVYFNFHHGYSHCH